MKIDSDDIRYAYRLILGREPDPPGFEHFLRFIRDKDLGPGDLGDLFIGSAEYASRQALRGSSIEVEFDGYSMFVGSDDCEIGQAVRRGSYEPHVTAALKELLGPGNNFVDVGANIGFFVALAAKIVGPIGRVVAIEPMDKNVQLINATIWRNKFTNVDVFPFAASSSKQILPMTTNSGTSNGEVISASTDGRVPDLFANGRTLDDMLLGLDRVDLIKFDIEGHELNAWRGFTNGISRFRPMVLTEFHPRCMRENAGVEPSDYLDLLFEYGASIEVLLGPTERVLCRQVSEVVSQWEAADRRLLSQGSTHLDLLVMPRS